MLSHSLTPFHPTPTHLPHPITSILLCPSTSYPVPLISSHPIPSQPLITFLLTLFHPSCPLCLTLYYSIPSHLGTSYPAHHIPSHPFHPTCTIPSHPYCDLSHYLAPFHPSFPSHPMCLLLSHPIHNLISHPVLSHPVHTVISHTISSHPMHPVPSCSCPLPSILFPSHLPYPINSTLLHPILAQPCAFSPIQAPNAAQGLVPTPDVGDPWHGMMVRGSQRHQV